MRGGNYSPEQERAFTVLKTSISNYRDMTVDYLPSKLLETDYKAFCKKSILKEALPHDFWWVWNQSNGKTERWLNDKIKVKIQKFNPRKKAGYKERNTPYKLWVFNMENAAGEFLISFIWCEKGVDLRNEGIPSDFQFECESWNNYALPVENIQPTIVVPSAPLHYNYNWGTAVAVVDNGYSQWASYPSAPSYPSYQAYQM